MNAAKCLNCDMLLTRTELADGWCDSCGKRLPSALTQRPADRPPAQVAAAASRPVGGVGRFFAIFGLSLVCGLIGAVVAGIVSGGALAHMGGMAGAAMGGGFARGLLSRPPQA